MSRNFAGLVPLLMDTGNHGEPVYIYIELKGKR